MKRYLISLALVNILLFSLDSWAQEEKETPSQKTKEAIEKFRKAPAVVGKSLETLMGGGKAKLQEMLETKAPPKVETDSLTLPARKPQEPGGPRYSPIGKRDPFRPSGLKTRVGQRTQPNLSPLERYEIGQLKLVGIVWDAKEPKAIIEDGTGLGYIVKIGTPIGDKEGKVKTIKPTEIVIEEMYTDFYGARKIHQRSMKLPEE